MKKDLGLFTLLIVLCLSICGIEIAKQLHSGIPVSLPRFLSPENLLNTANLIGIFGILSIGMGMVIITGGIDLSVGSMCALCGVLLCIALKDWHLAWPLAALFVVFVPMLMGYAHGFLITRMQLQPFIVTLCGLLVYRSMARFFAGDATKGFGDPTKFHVFKFIASGRLFEVHGEKFSFDGLPMPFVMLVIIAIIMWFVLHRSVYGRYLFAVGRNEEAARFSGINTKLVISGAYMLAGLLTGIAAIMFAFYAGSISPSTHANFYESYGIAAAVLGGCSLRGGEGSIIGIVIGATLLQILQNLVVILGIDGSLNFGIMGSVVLIGVLADRYFQKRRARKDLLQAK